MSSVEISLITLACLMAGEGFGMWLQYRLPDHHLSKDSQDTVKLGAGMVATMSALILGLLVSSAKTAFDNMNSAIAQNGAKIIQLDHLLAEFGPSAQPLRDTLKRALADRVQKVWGGGGIKAVERSTVILDLQSRFNQLSTANDVQKSAMQQACQLATEIWSNRLLMVEEEQEPVPKVFLVLLNFWLTLLFLSFGLFAPRNLTVLGVLFVCALSVASAVFLILEMNHPLDGLIKVSSAPMLKALELIGH
jgi:hypothetical protein